MLVDKDFTINWWTRLCNDEERMNAWLVKLYHTELDGYSSNFEANAKWNKTGIVKVEKFLVKTAQDELRHADLLRCLLARRGVYVDNIDIPEESLYWSEMDKHVVGLRSCCAVFYFGEQLATERFQVIYDHPDTPVDVMAFIESALPDETYHAHGFKSLAGDSAINAMLQHHNRVLSELLKR